MVVFLLSFVLGSEDGHIPTFWLLLYSLVLLSLGCAVACFILLVWFLSSELYCHEAQQLCTVFSGVTEKTSHKDGQRIPYMLVLPWFLIAVLIYDPCPLVFLCGLPQHQGPNEPQIGAIYHIRLEFPEGIWTINPSKGNGVP